MFEMLSGQKPAPQLNCEQSIQVRVLIRIVQIAYQSSELQDWRALCELIGRLGILYGIRVRTALDEHRYGKEGLKDDQ